MTIGNRRACIDQLAEIVATKNFKFVLGGNDHHFPALTRAKNLLSVAYRRGEPLHTGPLRKALPVVDDLARFGLPTERCR